LDNLVRIEKKIYETLNKLNDIFKPISQSSQKIETQSNSSIIY